jgi:hypothetical protein
MAEITGISQNHTCELLALTKCAEEIHGTYADLIAVNEILASVSNETGVAM